MNKETLIKVENGKYLPAPGLLESEALSLYLDHARFVVAPLGTQTMFEEKLFVRSVVLLLLQI